MSKMCPGCARELEDTQFNFKQESIGRRQVYCHECSRRYSREHYAKNRDYYVGKALKRNREVRRDVHQRLLAYLREHPCVDCGEADPLVLHFDHADPSNKHREVARLLRAPLGWSTVAAEIAKCEVRCANCHMRRTARQFNWYRLARPDGLEPPTSSFEG